MVITYVIRGVRTGASWQEKAPPKRGSWARAMCAAYITFGSLNASISPLNASTGMHAHMMFLSP